jgi:GT2 family glycosyltransferase
MIMAARPSRPSSPPTVRWPSVAVVIVNFETPEQTIACVRSLQSQQYDSLSIMVVDNASRDGSAEKIARALPDIRLIQANENGGYTSGNNVGMDAALASGAEYILVLNPDTVSLSDSFLKELVDFAEERPRVAAVGPRVHLRQVGQVQNTVLEFPWITRRIWGVAKRWMRQRPAPRSGNEPRPAEVLNGVCVLFRAEALFDVGLFDERTFAYIEDVDWAYRAQSLGWQLWYLPVDAIRHDQKESGYERGSTVEFLLKRNTLYFLLKNRRRCQAVCYTLSTLVMAWRHRTGSTGDSHRWSNRLLAAYRGLWLGQIDRVMGRPQLIGGSSR